MRFSAVLLAAMLIVPPDPSQQQRADQAIFRSRTDVVSVPVSVRLGRAPVSDLTSHDFVLLDNGVPQSIDALALEQVPLDLTLALAATLATNGPAAGMYEGFTREILNRIDNLEDLRRLLTPSDRLRIVLIDLRIRDELIEIGAPVRRSIMSLLPSWFSAVRWNGRVRLADGIFYALAWPTPPDRQHLVVLVGEGWDTGSALDMRKVPTLAARSDAVFHAVLYFPQGPATTYADQHRKGTSDPAIGAAVEVTGGTILRPSDFDRTVRQIVTDFRASYLLRYTPRGVSGSGWHDLSVKVRRPGAYTIRARRGYEGG